MSDRPTRIMAVARFTHAQKTDLLQIGQRMSNILYNLAQDEKVPDGWRELARDWYTNWDEAKYPKVKASDANTVTGSARREK